MRVPNPCLVVLVKAHAMNLRRNIADILCIGCQKGSTSWLHSVITCHPRVYAFPNSAPITSTDKEAHFWDWNRARGVEWYRSLLTPPEPERLSLDFTPEYAFLSEAEIAECKALNPSAKVIYVLRDPLARAVSAIRMHLLWRYGREAALLIRPGAELERLVGKAKLFAHGDYVANARRWQKAYPDLILLHYESFHAEREKHVLDLFRTLGLDPSEITGKRAERLQRLLSGRVWASEPYVFTSAALAFLDGVTDAFRRETEAELGMVFSEHDQLWAEAKATEGRDPSHKP